MNSFLNITEVIIIFLISVTTLIFNPPIPLLAIPFMFIIFIRTVFILIERMNE
jgi:hypothetical protein